MEKYRPIPQTMAQGRNEIVPLDPTQDPLNLTQEVPLMTERELYDLEWNQQRIANRQHNLQLADNVFVGGTLFRCGVGMKRG